MKVFRAGMTTTACRCGPHLEVRFVTGDHCGPEISRLAHHSRDMQYELDLVSTTAGGLDRRAPSLGEGHLALGDGMLTTA